MDLLYELSDKKINTISLDFVRYLESKINWKQRLIAIKGARGVGKTTLMLQHIKKNIRNKDAVLYISLDHLYFSKNTLLDVADAFVKRGGKYLFIDEVHKYNNWSTELKNLYDHYSELQIVFTASSILDIYKGNADLSRRAVAYDLEGLSLREFIKLSHNIDFSVLRLSEVLKNHKELSLSIINKIKPIKIFNEYLQYGYYPFFIEGIEVFHSKLANTINLVLETDLPNAQKIDYSAIHKIKKLLYVISQSVPFKPNITKLSNEIGTTRPTLLLYLHYLELAKIIYSLTSNAQGHNFMNKPEKIFLQNSNLFYAISNEQIPQKGTLREVFFINQLSVNHKINYTEKGDFEVDRNLHFEIGGKSKSFEQIKGLKNAYVAADDIEIGLGNKIPLWLFGFLY